MIREATTFKFQEPKSVEPRFHPIFQLKQALIAPFFVANLPNGLVRGWRGVVVLPDGQYPSEITFHSSELLMQEKGYLDPLPDVIPFKGGNYFVVPLLWWKNYGHWLIDCIGRLLLARDYLPADTKYIIPAKADATRLETLRLIGIPRKQLELIDSSETWQLGHLWYAPMATRHGIALPPRGRQIGQTILRGLGIQPQRRDRRVFISRRNLGTRLIVNEEEVEACFRRYGFEVFLPGSLAFAEEVALFAEAKVLAENTGAGLTNIIFAQPDAIMLDMVDPNYYNTYSWGLASSLNSPYWYFFGETHPGISENLTNLKVPVDVLERTLQQISNL